jgi:hypothetical protein
LLAPTASVAYGIWKRTSGFLTQGAAPLTRRVHEIIDKEINDKEWRQQNGFPTRMRQAKSALISEVQ